MSASARNAPCRGQTLRRLSKRSRPRASATPPASAQIPATNRHGRAPLCAAPRRRINRRLRRYPRPTGVLAVWFLRFFARYFYVPAMLVGLIGLSVYLMGNGYRYLWLAFVILTAIGLSLSMELVLPYEEDWNRAHDDIGKDVAHGVVYELGNLITLGLLFLISLEIGR